MRELETKFCLDKDRLHFMVQIKYHRFNSVQTATSFKILNDKAVYILLDL